ncbi:MAG TPA: hypothetical protein VMR50_10490 [Myxococcota bacterium]|nr:hypothetical protein [Myxococcota bacterium]
MNTHPTDENNFTPIVLLGHFVMWGIPLLLTLTCGGMLELQKNALAAREATEIAACKNEAATIVHKDDANAVQQAYRECMVGKPV